MYNMSRPQVKRHIPPMHTHTHTYTHMALTLCLEHRPIDDPCLLSQTPQPLRQSSMVSHSYIHIYLILYLCSMYVCSIYNCPCILKTPQYLHNFCMVDVWSATLSLSLSLSLSIYIYTHTHRPVQYDLPRSSLYIYIYIYI